MAHPYENPLSAITLALPSPLEMPSPPPDTRPWTVSNPEQGRFSVGRIEDLDSMGQFPADDRTAQGPREPGIRGGRPVQRAQVDRQEPRDLRQPARARSMRGSPSRRFRTAWPRSCRAKNTPTAVTRWPTATPAWRGKCSRIKNSPSSWQRRDGRWIAALRFLRASRLVTVHSLDGDWSIFRREIVLGAKKRRPKTWTCPLSRRKGDSPIFAARTSILL